MIYKPSEAFDVLDDLISDMITDEELCQGAISALLDVKSLMARLLVDRVPGSFQVVQREDTGSSRYDDPQEQSMEQLKIKLGDYIPVILAAKKGKEMHIDAIVEECRKEAKADKYQEAEKITNETVSDYLNDIPASLSGIIKGTTANHWCYKKTNDARPEGTEGGK